MAVAVAAPLPPSNHIAIRRSGFVRGSRLGSADITAIWRNSTRASPDIAAVGAYPDRSTATNIGTVRSLSDNMPMFFFVLEDRDDDGTLVRPHAHGAIELRRLPIDYVTDARLQRQYRRIEAKLGTKDAELLAGRWAIRRSLKAAAGLVIRPKVASTGVNQSRNVWSGKPRLPIFNSDWVYLYAQKHEPGQSCLEG